MTNGSPTNAARDPWRLGAGAVIVALLLPGAIILGRASLSRTAPPAEPPSQLAVFADVTDHAGIDTPHLAFGGEFGDGYLASNYGDPGAEQLPVAPDPSSLQQDRQLDRYWATGQAWGDYDQDGWVDLYLTSHMGPSTLYRNNGDGTFEVSPHSEDVALEGHISGGATFVDYNNNGWPDLYVLGLHSDALFRNDEGRGFTNVTAEAGLGGVNAGVTASWADFDGDGYLDLFVASNTCLGCSYPDLDTVHNRLYRNNGNGTFTDMTEAIDVSPRVRGPTFAAGWLDYDNDGSPDLYIVNDVQLVQYLPGNVLLRNDGPGCGSWCFTDVSEETGADVEINGMGIAVGDYDNDGHLDIHATNVGAVAALPGAGLSVLLRGEDGVFEEVGRQTGAGVDAITWGTVFLDYNNDGWKDLFVATGFEDPAFKAAAANRNRLLRNLGDGTFEDDTAAAGTEQTTRSTLGVAWADYNNNGWPDLVLGHHDYGYTLHANTATAGEGNHRMVVRLKGDGPVNRDAVGARVYLEGAGATQMQEVMLGSSLGSGNDLALHFGMGSEDAADIRVVWPDGTEQFFADVPAGLLWELSYGGQPSVAPLAAPNVAAQIAEPLPDSGVRAGGLVIPILALLTTLALAVYLVAQWTPTPGVAGYTLSLLLVWAVSFQVAHLAEHFAQVGFWIFNPSDPPWITPWGRVATDGFAALAGQHGGIATGTELLHLAGNWIFLAGLIPALMVSRSHWRGRGWLALRVAFYVELVHVIEHVSLTTTWFLLNRPIGMSTLFGSSFMLPGAWPTSIRIWWHFFANLIPTVAAVIAVVRFDFDRAGFFPRHRQHEPAEEELSSLGL